MPTNPGNAAGAANSDSKLNLPETDIPGSSTNLGSAQVPADPAAKSADDEQWYGNRWLHIALLLALTWICFGRTLSTYFLADDFGEIQYVSRIFNGEPQLLWSNFVGNYMQIAGMNVWRPGLITTLVIDYLLYGTKAWGYYLTNLLYFSGCVVLLYTVARQLTAAWPVWRSAAAACLGAALFAASPLRCESVSWMVGRVDIVSCFFYLLSFSLLLAAQTQSPRSRFALALSVVFFWIGLLTKEMAVGLPVVAVALGFWGLPQGGQPETLTARCKAAFKISLPFWLSLVVYFALRMLFLGTLVGGYTAGFGASQLSFMVQRWTDVDTLHRLLFPFNYGLIKEPNLYSNLLAACYAVLAALVGYRLMTGQLSFRWAAFLFIWAASAVAPIFQLWGLGYNLEGSRFYWFVSMPLCLSVPILLFYPAAEESKRDRRLLSLAAITLTVAIFALAKVAFMTNALWVRAGKEVRAVAEAAQVLAREHPSSSFAVFGIPKDRSGAHLILNGGTFNTMLAAPFLSERLDSRFHTFDPIMFGPAELISSSRLEQTLDKPGVIGPLLWSGKERKFEAITLAASPSGQPGTISLPLSNLTGMWQPHTLGGATYSFKDDVARLDDVRDGDGLLFKGLNINPRQFDFLECDVRVTGAAPGSKIQARWSGYPLPKSADQTELAEQSVGAAILADRADFQHVRIRLSHYWRWFVYPRVTELTLLPPHAQSCELRNLRLTDGAMVVPHLAIEDATVDNTGVANIRSATLKLVVDQIDAASGTVLEIGKPNFFFDNFQFAAPDTYIAQSVEIDGGAKTKTIAGDEFHRLFPLAGYYQLRSCRRAGGKPVGEYSDPVTIRTF